MLTPENRPILLHKFLWTKLRMYEWGNFHWNQLLHSDFHRVAQEETDFSAISEENTMISSKCMMHGDTCGLSTLWISYHPFGADGWRTSVPEEFWSSFIHHLLRMHRPSISTASYLLQLPPFSLLAECFAAAFFFSHGAALMKTCADVPTPTDWWLILSRRAGKLDGAEWAGGSGRLRK